MSCDISVVIPLYNKEKEIGRAIKSVLRQTVSPLEIIIVDDGSTDDSALVAESYLGGLSNDNKTQEANNPEVTVKVITQKNAGVSAARNKGISEARGGYIALLDGDDYWEDSFIEKMSELINTYPDCGIYASGFWIEREGKKHLAKSPKSEGVLEDYFCSALNTYVCTASSVVIPKRVATQEGKFPLGMKIGEDQYCWISIASQYPVCFTPEPLAVYVLSASNRSTGIYTPEKTDYSFEDFYRPEEGNSCRNEFIARCALGKALILSSKGDTAYGKRSAKFFDYTTSQRRALRKLRILNLIPKRLRGAAHNTYNTLAWKIARKGL